MSNPLLLASSISHPKRRGEWVEILFLLHAAAHGFTVSKPWGDSATYDFVVEGHNFFFRVQVKSTRHRSGGGRSFHCQLQDHQGNACRYTRENVDFLAIYVIPADAWYIVPISAVLANGSPLRFDPTGSGIASPLEQFREKWGLLAGGRIPPARQQSYPKKKLSSVSNPPRRLRAPARSRSRRTHSTLSRAAATTAFSRARQCPERAT